MPLVLSASVQSNLKGTTRLSFKCFWILFVVIVLISSSKPAKSQVYRLNFPEVGLTILDKNVGDHDWSPDGRYIAYTKRNLEQRERLRLGMEGEQFHPIEKEISQNIKLVMPGGAFPVKQIIFGNARGDKKAIKVDINSDLYLFTIPEVYLK